MTAILDLLNRRQQDWATLAKSEAGTVARGFVTVHKGEAVYATVNDKPLRIDETTMCSYGWKISTKDLDREGDTINPNSPLGTLKNYKRNPVVSFDHFRFDPLPVGTSFGEGDAPLTMGGDGIEANCKHHDQTKMARDVWNLTKSGVLRSASIAFLPLKARQMGDIHKGSLKSPRFQFDEIDVTEWAICSVPVNPEAVRMQLSRGAIECDEFKKSLADFAEKPLEYAHGWSPEAEPMPVKMRDIQAFRFAKSSYPKSDDAKAILESIGGDPSLLVENDTSWDFVQQEGAHHGSIKLKDMKGVQGLLLKADDKIQECVSKKIKKLIDEGKPQDQAAAIAYQHCRDLHKQKSCCTECDEREVAVEEPVVKSKGAPRVTHTVKSLGDMSNHVKGCLEYLTKSMELLDHDPTVELYQKFSEMNDEMQKMIGAHVKEHFDGVDMEAVTKAQAQEIKEGKEQKKKVAEPPPNDDAKLKAVLEKLDKRDSALDKISTTLTAAKEKQDVVQKRFQLN